MTILTQISCGDCGFVFSLPAEFVRARQQDGNVFSCPNGHRISYKPSAKDKRIAELEKDIERHRKLRERAEEDWHREHNFHSDTLADLRACPVRCGWRSRKIVKRYDDEDAFARGLIRVQADVAAHLAEEHGVEVGRMDELIEELAR